MSSITDNLAKLPQMMVDVIGNPDNVKYQEIKNNYFGIWETVKQMSDEAGDGGCNIEDLNSNILGKLDKTFKEVVRTEEIHLDGQILSHISGLGKSTIQKSQSGFLSFHPSEYAANLINFLNNGESLSDIFEHDSLSLCRLANEMAHLYKSTYGFEPLYGALEWEPPKTKRAAPLQKDNLKKNVVKKSMEKLKDGTTNEENQVEEVTRIFNVLKRRFQENQREPIPLLEFVIDPTCFATTVQNLFHTTFLMRDNHVHITFDEYSIPCISPVRKKTSEQTQNIDHAQHRQSVLEMNVDIWNEAIKVIGIKHPMIPKVVNLKRQI